MRRSPRGPDTRGAMEMSCRSLLKLGCPVLSPTKPFAELADARTFAATLVHRYDHEHRHSAISFVTPAQRHDTREYALHGFKKDDCATAAFSAA